MSNKRKRYIPRKSEGEYDQYDMEESEYFLPTTTYKIKRNIDISQAVVDAGVRLGETFYNTTCEDLAKGLLGKILVRQLEGSVLKGRIVETECYLGAEDKASHSYQGKITTRNEPMFMKPGTIYIYLTYGMYALFNISSQGEGAAVLLRALEPLQGQDEMQKFRNNPRPDKPAKQTTKIFKSHELCNGPAKLCISFQIDKTLNKKDLSKSSELWIEDGITVPEHKIVTSHRIGVESAGLEWSSKLLRYYIIDNKSVSKRDKHQEVKLKEVFDFVEYFRSVEFNMLTYCLNFNFKSALAYFFEKLPHSEREYLNTNGNNSEPNVYYTLLTNILNDPKQENFKYICSFLEMANVDLNTYELIVNKMSARALGELIDHLLRQINYFGDLHYNIFRRIVKLASTEVKTNIMSKLDFYVLNLLAKGHFETFESLLPKEGKTKLFQQISSRLKESKGLSLFFIICKNNQKNLLLQLFKYLSNNESDEIFFKDQLSLILQGFHYEDGFS